MEYISTCNWKEKFSLFSVVLQNLLSLVSLELHQPIFMGFLLNIALKCLIQLYRKLKLIFVQLQTHFAWSHHISGFFPGGVPPIRWKLCQSPPSDTCPHFWTKENKLQKKTHSIHYAIYTAINPEDQILLPTTIEKIICQLVFSKKIYSNQMLFEMLSWCGPIEDISSMCKCGMTTIQHVPYITQM